MVRRSVRALLLATSLLVFAASAALWARGYFREDRVEWMSTEDVPGRLTYRVWQFTSFRGSFCWEWKTLSITDDTVIVPTRRTMAVVPAFQYFPAPGRLSPWYSVAFTCDSRTGRPLRRPAVKTMCVAASTAEGMVSGLVRSPGTI